MESWWTNVVEGLTDVAQREVSSNNIIEFS